MLQLFPTHIHTIYITFQYDFKRIFGLDMILVEMIYILKISHWKV